MEQTYVGTLVLVTCGGCSIKFGLDSSFHSQVKESHETFHCPNGCRISYSGKSEAQKLQDELSYVRTRRDELYQQIQQLNYSVRAQKAAKTKIMNRVKNGVCPCCNRTFSDLQRHFKSKHPDLVNPPSKQTT